MKYSYATKAYQPIVGCANDKPCLARCWAHPAIRRTVKCLEKDHPERAAFFRQFVTPTGWTGKVAIDEQHLADPLKWKAGQIVATGFHGDVGLLPFEDLDRIMAVSPLCPQHTILLLTKRPERLVEYVAEDLMGRGARHRVYNRQYGLSAVHQRAISTTWPLPNIWIGASVEDQPSATERLRWLRKLALAGWNTWISYEPAIGPVDWEKELNCNDAADDGAKTPGLFRWLVVGGESGKNARPFDIAWARSVRDQCAAAGTPFYMKQMGAFPVVDACRQNHFDFGEGIGRKARFSPVDKLHPSTGLWHVHFKDRSGSDPAEWPEDLRIQQTPWEAR